MENLNNVLRRKLTAHTVVTGLCEREGRIALRGELPFNFSKVFAFNKIYNTDSHYDLMGSEMTRSAIFLHVDPFTFTYYPMD